MINTCTCNLIESFTKIFKDFFESCFWCWIIFFREIFFFLSFAEWDSGKTNSIKNATLDTCTMIISNSGNFIATKIIAYQTYSNLIRIINENWTQSMLVKYEKIAN